MKATMTFLFALFTAWTQAQTVTASRTIGGNSDEHANDVVAAGDGSYIIAGYSNSSQNGDVTGENHGSSDAWIVKVDDNGDILWQLLVGGSNADVATGITRMPAGELFVVGYTFSNDGDFPEHYGSTFTSDVFVLKISADGELIWSQTMGSNYDDIGADVICANSNRVVIGGTIEGTGSDIQNILGLRDMWMLMIDGNGNILWENTYGGALDDELHHLVLCPDGGIYAAGMSESFSGTSGDHEGVLMKIDADGEMEWQTALGSESASDDCQTSSFETDSEGLVIIGFTTTGSEDGVNCTPHGSVLMARINSEGELLTIDCYGGSSHEYVNSVIQGDHVWALASTRSVDGDVPDGVSVNSTSYDAWLMRSLPEGGLSGGIRLGGSGTDRGVAVVQGNDGQLLSVINTHSTDGLASGQHGVLTDGETTSDILLVYTDSGPTSIGREEDAQTGTLLYPNPASDQLWLEITDSESDDDRITIVNSEGRVMFESVAGSGRQSIDVSAWAPGVYLLRRESPTGAEHIRWIRQ